MTRRKRFDPWFFEKKAQAFTTPPSPSTKLSATCYKHNAAITAAYIWVRYKNLSLDLPKSFNLGQMNDAKVEGNKLFGDGLYEEALLKYEYAIQLAPEMPSSSEIRSSCHNNRATCFFKLDLP
ncbi:tetratricopeptide repeat (TPR)-like superfamily protein [Artemisia annua]|uniref:Tetratricopeptide repeat (TPR)-like superfamily protein n=1 Tax=Artemisia annua TaxID=35608 RepID=A0A2U1L6Z3_ARTAN|nr:tetratricopeptide repeat (TPR)-like superfamily protein [Artemisia annua]